MSGLARKPGAAREDHCCVFTTWRCRADTAGPLLEHVTWMGCCSSKTCQCSLAPGRQRQSWSRLQVHREPWNNERLGLGRPWWLWSYLSEWETTGLDLWARRLGSCEHVERSSSHLSYATQPRWPSYWLCSLGSRKTPEHHGCNRPDWR